MSGNGISWAICKSAPHPKQITMPASHHSVFTGQMPFLPPNQQRQSTEGKVTHNIVMNDSCVRLYKALKIFVAKKVNFVDWCFWCLNYIDIVFTCSCNKNATLHN